MKADWKPGTLLAPVPVVMVSMADAAGKANILTVAWTGIVSSDPVKVYISVRPERYSYHILKETGEFVINAVTASLARACDYCGMVTGKKVDKFAKCGLTKESSKVVRPPRIGESPLALECRVTDVQDHGVHHMFLPLRYNYDKPEKTRISRVFGYLARFFILFQTEKSSREVVIS